MTYAPRPARRLAATLLGVMLAVLGCSDQLTDPTPVGVSPTILDGSNASGNPHFFFLPPRVPEQAPNAPFESTLSPVVSICQLSGDACVTELGLQDLEGNLPLVLDVVSQVDRGHAALTEFGLDAVVAG